MSLLKAGKSTVFMTGGGTGIGLALAKRLVALGNNVIVSGRRESLLKSAKDSVPSLITIQGDIETDEGRLKLFDTVAAKYPDVNVLINNAGIGHELPPLKDTKVSDWEKHKSILRINLEAPIHLSTLFLPNLLAKSDSLIVNVSSGLAFFPFAPYASYSATKGEWRSW